VGDLAGEVLAEGLRLAFEDVAAILQRLEWDVTGAPDPAVVGLRHEGDRAAVLLGELLDPVLVDDVPVRGLEGVGEPEVDLLLPRPRLTLGALDGDPAAFMLLRTARMKASS